MSKPGSPETEKRVPGSNERIIGLLILATVAALVIVFLVSGGLFAGVVDRTPVLGKLKRIIGVNEDRLFDVAPGSASPASPPVEIQIARKLLPVPRGHNGDYGYYAAYAVRPGEKIDVIREIEGPVGGQKPVVRGLEEPDPLAKQAAALGAGWIYTYRYSVKGPQLLLRIVDVGLPSNAEKLSAARRPANAKVLNLGRGSWQDEVYADCGFWTGRYYTEVLLPGRTARGAAELGDVRQIAADLAANQLVYGGEAEVAKHSVKEAATKPMVQVARAGDFATVPGGQALPPSKIERFTDNLYEKIDGKEGMFRAFHFVELRFGQYTHAQTQDAFDVYVYDMGEPVNAFGIYMGERSPTAEAWSLGRDAYVSGISVYFCKDKYYVNVLGPPEGAVDKLEVSKAIATAIAGTIPDGDKPFWVEQYLPGEGRVPDSLKYEATSGLGYDFVQRLFRAEYKADGKTFQVFVVKADDAAAARGLFDKYAEATAKYDKVLSKEADARGQRMVGESLGVFSVAFSRGMFFGGVAECEDQALAVKQAEAFRARLPDDAAGAAEPSSKPATAAVKEE